MGEPPVRMEDLQKGDPVFRKGLPAEVVQAGHEALLVRMQDGGNEVNADCTKLSLGMEASQRWNVRLDSSQEIICAKPRNLSVLFLPSTVTPNGAAPGNCLDVSAKVRLEGLEDSI